VPSRLRLRRDDARRMWTTAGAHLEHTEQRRGALLPGMLADFVVVDRDVMAVPDAALLSVNPLRQFVGGRTPIRRRCQSSAAIWRSIRKTRLMTGDESVLRTAASRSMPSDSGPSGT
jgi:hypothetical protein